MDDLDRKIIHLLAENTRAAFDNLRKVAIIITVINHDIF